MMQELIHDLMQKALSVPGADYMEVRIEETTRTSVVYAGKELERIGETTGRGGCIRASVHGGWGFVSFNDLSDLTAMARRAIEMASLVGKDETKLAPSSGLIAHESCNPGIDPRTISLAEKHDLTHNYNSLLLSDPSIQSTSTRYVDSCKRKHLLTSDGVGTTFEEVFCGVSLAAIARDGGTVQQYFRSYGNLAGYEEAQGHESDAETVCSRAVDALHADPVQAGTYRIIADPELSGIFAHEAFGHLSECDFLDENPRLQKVMRLGRRFGCDELTISDHGDFQHAGYIPFDDEGTPARRTDLIHEGILRGRLHSRESAAKLDEEPTGNARSISYHYPPIVRMTNTFIDNGTSSFVSMLEEIGDGLYCKGALAGQTNCEMFTFTPLEVFEIKNGKIGKRLRDCVLTGNVFETLMKIRLVGNDLQFSAGLGGCGKSGQSPLRVSTGAPHLLIDDVVVGGV